MITLPSGATSVVFNSVTGSITTGCASTEGCIVLNNGTGNNANDPDGVGAAPATSSNTGTSSISGMIAPGAGYLVGLFVPAGGPVGAAPAALDFTSTGLGTAFTSLSPQLDQVFFIGDGLTGNGTGTQQTFNIPTGAVQLWLGISDAGGYVGAPGAYGDNLGLYTVGLSVNAPGSSAVTVTETAPSGLTLVSMAGTGWTCGRREHGQCLHTVRRSRRRCKLPGDNGERECRGGCDIASSEHSRRDRRRVSTSECLGLYRHREQWRHATIDGRYSRNGNRYCDGQWYRLRERLRERVHGESAGRHSSGVDAGGDERFDIRGMEWRADVVHGCRCHLYVYDASVGGDGYCDVYGSSGDVEVDCRDAGESD